MDYAEARAAFFAPRDVTTTGADGWASPARRLRDAIEPIATISFWAEPAYDTYAALGLDFLTGYVWSRACVLGEPDGGVVAAAFGVFEPGLIGQLYDAARQACGLTEIRAARQAGATEALRAVLGHDPGIGAAAATLRRAADLVEPAGRPLAAGVAGLPWPEDELAGLWHGATLLREYRGDSHLAACAAANLSGLEANLLTEAQVGWEPQSYTASRGWAAEAMDAASARLRERGLLADGGLTGAGTALRDQVERATDDQVAALAEAVGADALPTLAGFSERIVASGWFPPDPYKRASG